MTQEGQGLPSPTPPENPVEPNTAASTTDPPTETHHQTEVDKLGARANDDTEEVKQQEEIREGEEEAQQEAHREGEGREGDEGGEGEVKEEKLDSNGGDNQQTDGGMEGDGDETRGDGCTDVKVISTGEEAAHREVEKMEEEEEEEKEGKDNKERHPSAEDPQQAKRLVHYIIFTVAPF